MNAIDKEARRYVDTALQFTTGVTFIGATIRVAIRSRLRAAQALLQMSGSPEGVRANAYVTRALTLIDPIETSRLQEELYHALRELTPSWIAMDVQAPVGLGAAVVGDVFPVGVAVGAMQPSLSLVASTLRFSTADAGGQETIHIEQMQAPKGGNFELHVNYPTEVLEVLDAQGRVLPQGGILASWTRAAGTTWSVNAPFTVRINTKHPKPLVEYKQPYLEFVLRYQEAPMGEVHSVPVASINVEPQTVDGRPVVFSANEVVHVGEVVVVSPSTPPGQVKAKPFPRGLGLILLAALGIIGYRIYAKKTGPVE